MDRLVIAGPGPDSPRIALRFKLYGGNRCVFSQLTRATDDASSYKLAPRIIEEIGRHTGKDPQTMRFFDLQKRTAYPLIARKPDGFAFDEVVIDQSGTPNWMPARCPRDIAKDFASRRSKPRQILRCEPASTF